MSRLVRALAFLLAVTVLPVLSLVVLRLWASQFLR